MSNEVVAATPKLDRFSLWKSDSDLSDIHFGFEFEFASKLDRDDFASELSDAMNIPSDYIEVYNGYHSSDEDDKDYTIWNVEGDTSIRKRGAETDIELVTPPHNIGYWSSHLETVLDLIKEHGRTVKGTGAHITFSYRYLHKIDPIKFALFINDVNVADTFGRALHSYALLYLNNVRTYVFNHYQISGKNIPDILKDIRDKEPSDIYETDKFTSINLSKLDNDPPLIEIRSPGGYDYENKGTDFLRICRILASAIIVSCDSEAYPEVYAHKFGKLLAVGNPDIPLVSESIPSPAPVSDDTWQYRWSTSIGNQAYTVSARLGYSSAINYKIIDKDVYLRVMYDNNQGDPVLYLDCSHVVGINRSAILPIAQLIQLIRVTPVGSYLPGVPADVVEKCNKSSIAQGEDTVKAYPYFGKKPSASVHTSNNISFLLRVFVKPTAVSLINAAQAAASGSSATYQIEYLNKFVGALADNASSYIEYHFKDAQKLYEAAPEILMNLAEYAGKQDDPSALHNIFRAVGSDLISIPSGMYSDLANAFVASVPLGSDKALDILSGAVSSIASSNLPASVKLSMSAQLQARVDEYIEQAPESDLLRGLYLSIANVSKNRTELQKLCVLCFQKPNLKTLLLDQVLGNFDYFIHALSSKHVDLCNLIWIVDDLDIPDTEKLLIWRAQYSSTPRNKLLNLADSVDTTPLVKWDLAAGADEESRTQTRKDHAVILFGAMLKHGSAALSAYDGIMAMYASLPEKLRMGCTRYVFTQLSSFLSAPRTKLWTVLSGYLLSMVDGLATCTESDTALVRRASTLPKFTDDVDIYLGEGSSFWRKDRPQHCAKLASILQNHVFVDGNPITLQQFATNAVTVDAEAPGNVTYMVGSENRQLSEFNINLLQKYARALIRVVALIKERPTA